MHTRCYQSKKNANHNVLKPLDFRLTWQQVEVGKQQGWSHRRVTGGLPESVTAPDTMRANEDDFSSIASRFHTCSVGVNRLLFVLFLHELALDLRQRADGTKEDKRGMVSRHGNKVWSGSERGRAGEGGQRGTGGLDQHYCGGGARQAGGGTERSEHWRGWMSLG